MKKLNAFVFALIVFTHFGQAGEMIGNGGFEDLTGTPWRSQLTPAIGEFYAGTQDSLFDNWAFGGGWEHGEYSISLSKDSHSGKNSCQITCLKKGRGGIAGFPFQIKAGTVLEVSCWLKAKNADGGRIFLNWEGSPGDGWASSDLKTGTYEWTRFNQRIVVPENKNGETPTLVPFLYSTCEGKIWVDDFSVQIADQNGDPEKSVGKQEPVIPAESRDSAGYRVSVVSPLEKVFPDGDFSTTISSVAECSAARNEFESLQIVVEAPWRSVNIQQVRISDLKGFGMAAIPSTSFSWNQVGYVETKAKTPYFAEHGPGKYPDPLMPGNPFTVDWKSRVAIWVTIKIPADCPAGDYQGNVTLVPDGLKPTVVPIRLKVWDFNLPEKNHLRTLTWLNTENLRAWYGYSDSTEEKQKQEETVQNYESFLLEHRLGPGGDVASGVQRNAEGGFNFQKTDEKLQRLIGQGMNAFIMGTAPNLAREKKSEYSPKFVLEFTELLKAYGDHLREKGWLDLAYVYVYDEAPKSAWPEVRKIDQAIHAAAPGLRILQCLNDPEGVKELTGAADVFDVYIPHYQKTEVAAAQEKGSEAWLAICCYPMEHPNFFLEYPLLDARVTPWICWKNKATGFEYWSPNSWGGNLTKTEKNGRWPTAPWIANAFGDYNGDGYLLYPGSDAKPWSSIRFEALRDGLEDYEYLWILNSLLDEAKKRGFENSSTATAKKLLSLDDLIRPSGAYSSQTSLYLLHRKNLAESIIELQRILSPGNH